MLEKNYYLIAATYASETLPRYLKHYFSQHGILIQTTKADEYTIHNSLNQFLTNDTPKHEIFDYKKATSFKNKHKQSIEIFVKILRGIRKERNNLAHIGSSNAKNNLSQHLNNFEKNFITQKPFESFNSIDFMTTPNNKHKIL